MSNQDLGVRMEPFGSGQKDWNNTVSTFDELTLMQTWEYGEAKTQTGPWKVERMLFQQDDEMIGAVQAMVRPLPWGRGGLVWINRGPLWHIRHDADHSILHRMLRELRRHWVEQRNMYVRIAIPICITDTAADSVHADGFVSVEGAEGWASARLDLEEPLENLRKRLHQKWRNALNKSERFDFQCESGTTDAVFQSVLHEYEHMLQASPFPSTVTSQLLTCLQGILPEERKLWGMTAQLNGAAVGGILITRYGRTCEYLVGALNNTGRAVNAGYYLLWQAICYMKKLGLRWFDLGGLDMHKTPHGIFQFKAGLKATSYQFANEIEAHDGGLSAHAIRWWIRRHR